MFVALALWPMQALAVVDIHHSDIHHQVAVGEPAVLEARFRLKLPRLPKKQPVKTIICSGQFKTIAEAAKLPAAARARCKAA